MSRLLICLVVMLTLICGSIAHGASKPDLDTKATLSIINTVLEFYYARYYKNAEKIQSMFITPLSNYNLNRLSSASRFHKNKTMEFTELIVLSKKPFKVEVVIRFSYGREAPPWDYIMILKKIGDQWKISHFGGLGLP